MNKEMSDFLIYADSKDLIEIKERIEAIMALRKMNEKVVDVPAKEIRYGDYDLEEIMRLNRYTPLNLAIQEMLS